jgi:hypothetical protein
LACEALGSQRRTWTEHGQRPWAGACARGRCAGKRAPRHCWEHRDIKHIKHTHAYAQTLIRNAPNSENRAHRVHQTQTLTLVPARLPKGSKQDVSGSHTYTHTTTCVPPMHVTRTSHCHCCWWHWAGQPMGGGGHRGRPHRHHGAVTWRWRRWQLRCFPG